MLKTKTVMTTVREPSQEYKLGYMAGVAAMGEEIARLRAELDRVRAKLDTAKCVIGVTLGVGMPRWYEQGWIEIRESLRDYWQRAKNLAAGYGEEAFEWVAAVSALVVILALLYVVFG